MTTHAFFILIPSPPSLGNTYGLFPLLVFRVKKTNNGNEPYYLRVLPPQQRFRRLRLA